MADDLSINYIIIASLLHYIDLYGIDLWPCFSLVLELLAPILLGSMTTSKTGMPMILDVSRIECLCLVFVMTGEVPTACHWTMSQVCQNWKGFYDPSVKGLSPLPKHFELPI